MYEPSSTGVTVAGSSVGHEAAPEEHDQACRTARSAPRGRRRPAARPARRPGPRAGRPRSSAWAPTSIPRVGCAAISTFGLGRHLRARRSASAGCRPTVRARRPRGPACGRRSSSMISLVRRTAPAAVDPEALGERCAGSGARARRSPTAAPCSTRPSLLAVLRDVADARAPGAPACRRPGRRSPSRLTVPASRARMPMIASSSSVWPFPSTPAMPRISPAVDGERDVVEQSPGRPRPSR